MTSEFRQDLDARLNDLEFAKGFGAEAAKTDFALTLARARLFLGVTQTALARELGVSQSYIAKLERGDANPTIGMAGRILAVLGLRIRTSATSLSPAPTPVGRQQAEVSSQVWQHSVAAVNTPRITPGAARVAPEPRRYEVLLS